MPNSIDLSLLQARLLALAAQGFNDRRSTGVPDRRALRRVVARTGLLQIDSVNVLTRAHYLPAFSRIGPYPTSTLDLMASRAPRELFEYWGHEASLLPVKLHPLLRWRMARPHQWNTLNRLKTARPDFITHILSLVRERGAVSAGALTEERSRRAGSWWERSETKVALELLFWAGEVTVAGRRGFERLYDLPERVLPGEVLNAPTPAPADAHRRLLAIAAAALGVATEGDLRDYFRLKPSEARPRIAELVETGELQPVKVEGWLHPAYLHHQVRLPRRIQAHALLVPFDPLIWERNRTERLFGMRYRIEIYVPAARRIHGYYVLPFLLGNQLVARVDLKADRQAKVLRVAAAHAEAETSHSTVAQELAIELHSMAGWLGLAGVAVSARGDLAPALQACLSP
ncbi:MAG: winged helix-turn-helix domain-containing protein [Candidatus Dormibacteraceae bacterium]